MYTNEPVDEQGIKVVHFMISRCLLCIVQHVKYNMKKRGITDDER